MRNCCVPNCKTRWGKNISLHAFPSNEIVKSKWKKVLGIQKELKKNDQVCYLHFKTDDYFLQGKAHGKNFLKRGVIPSCNLPNSSELSKSSSKGQIVGKIVTNLSLSGSLKKKTKKPQRQRKRDSQSRSRSSNNKKRRSETNSRQTSVRKKSSNKGPTPNGKRKISRKKHSGFLFAPVILHGSVATEPLVPNEEFKEESSDSLVPDPWKSWNSGITRREANGFLFSPFILQGSTATERFVPADDEIKDEPPDSFELDPWETHGLDKSMRIHIPDFIDCEQRPQQEGCVICSKKILNREVCTFCPDCPETPPLCLQPCFREYHGY